MWKEENQEVTNKWVTVLNDDDGKYSQSNNSSSQRKGEDISQGRWTDATNFRF